MTKKQKLSDIYKELNPIEHVLHRPETYVGSILTEEKELFLVSNIDDNDIKLTKQKVNYNPAYIKIYDEAIVNVADHYIRTDEQVKNIRINIDIDSITIYNDGPGIPVEIHDTKKVWLPEMLFGRLMSGQNFNDNETRFTGGRNGFGISLTNIFSKKFIVDCADGKNSYKQIFSDNLGKKTKPIIESCKKSYTKITYYPDFEKFGLEENNEDIIKVFYKRAIDIAMYCNKANVYFNDSLIKLKNFKDYIKMYNSEEIEFFYEKVNENWEIGISKNDYDNFEQVSIVNGINTYNGGTHVNFITNQIVTGISEQLQKRFKKTKINVNDIKRNLCIYLCCKIPNPAFDSQTKETLITKIIGDIAKDIIVSDNTIKKVVNSEIIENIINYIEAKELAALKKENKISRRIKIKKLDDANKAGSDESEKCSLFLAEGDSAAGTIIAGLSELGRDYYGIFPLKGKPLNVRNKSKFEKEDSKGHTISHIKDNEEIKNIISALGLEFGKKYEDTSKLRYGRVVFMTDSDNDGLHIKGLLINLFNVYWPELLKINFIYEFITPVISAIKRDKIKYFYKIEDYVKWKNETDQSGYFFKFYKGLGTIQPQEAKFFFKNIKKHLIKLNYTDEVITENLIDMLFAKKRSDERKDWLTTYKPNNLVDKFNNQTTYKSFFNDEFIEFSMYDNIRSIPSIIDGLKPSQRKVIYTMLTKNITHEVKVSQLTGSIIDIAAYHHGSVSLEETILGLAQDFVGSNNLNLLLPKGNFGSRLLGGADSAAPRYIFTNLNKITRNILIKNDDEILNYNDDDGKQIEPVYYLPIIPLILVNGCKGIGTGYSTDIPLFNIQDIIKWFNLKLIGKNSRLPINPYYNNFKGDIIELEDNKYITRGIIEKINTSTLKIKELPIKIWTNNYYDVLDKLIDNKVIKDYKKNSTDVSVDIDVYISREKLIELEENDNLYKIFELESSISLNNMMAFDENNMLKKYENQYHILEEFYNFRLIKYQDRKNYLIQNKNKEINILKNRIKFIEYIVDKKIIINNKTKEEIILNLDKYNFDKIDDSYSYLLDMRIYNLSKDKIDDLKLELSKEELILNDISIISIQQMWLKDLQELKKNL